MAVKGAARSFSGRIVLLRTHPRSGTNAFGLVLRNALRQASGDDADFLVDLDYLDGTNSLDDYLRAMSSHQPILVLKTHLAQSEFMARYPFLLPSIQYQVKLFRTPLDVAVSTYKYISGIPGALPLRSEGFADFFHQWIRARGNSGHFGHFVSWLDYAEETLANESAIPGESLYFSFEDVAALDSDFANHLATDLVAHRGNLSYGRQFSIPAASKIDFMESLGANFFFDRSTSYLASGRFGELLTAGAFTSLLHTYMARFAPTVNRLIRERRILVKIL